MARQVQEKDVAVSAKTRRILAIDIIRGYFLLVIMINHVELYPNGFDFFTGRGRFLVSAAEGFFFMSGLLIGMVYKRRIAFGMKFIFQKMWQRALQLYIGSVILTLLFTWWAVASHHPAIKYGLPEPYSWHWIIRETFLMRFGFGWADFLMRFAILMIFAPFVFYLVAKRKWWLALAGIIAVWAVRGQDFTLGWQLLFNGGIIIGFYWQQLTDWYKKLKVRPKNLLKISIVSITVVSFIYSYLSVFALDPLNHYLSNLPMWLQRLTIHWDLFNDHLWVYDQKWTMGPLRVFLFFCWFFVLYAVVRRYERSINRWTRGTLELLGSNSLFVYIAHAFIIFILKFFMKPYFTSFWPAFLYTALGIVLLIAVTVIYRLINTNPWPTNISQFKSLLSKSKTLLSGNS